MIGIVEKDQIDDILNDALTEVDRENQFKICKNILASSDKVADALFGDRYLPQELLCVIVNYRIIFKGLRFYARKSSNSIQVRFVLTDQNNSAYLCDPLDAVRLQRINNVDN